MVPNIDGIMGHKKNIQDMEHSALFSIQQTETHHNAFKKMKLLYFCLGCTTRYQNLRDIESVKT